MVMTVFLRSLTPLLAVLMPAAAPAAASVRIDDPQVTGLEPIVFATRTVPQDGHWYANISYAAPGPQVKRYGDHGRLCLLDPATGVVTDLINDPAGSVRDPQVHYDGQRILFAYRPGATEHYHLYEIGIDGGGLHQLTEGPYDDFEPTYLPDGKLLFVSTRCRRWVNCWLTQVAVLHLCEADGSRIRQVSANIEQDNTPWPLPDGRVIYQRWEYIDRSQVHYHHLWTMNPDGTGQAVYYGNLRPGIVMIDAKPIPGTQEVVAIFSPGHGRREHAGRVTILDQERGPDDPAAARTLTQDQNYRDPYPLADGTFLAAHNHEIHRLDRQGRHHVVYALPESLRRQGVWLHEPRPVRTRPRERVAVARHDSDRSTGRFFLYDVHQGRNLPGVGPGDIRSLLVVESLPKPINYTGGMDPLSYGGTFTLERILGTVPVAPDGSAFFEAPALRSLFFIALDAEGRAVKRMQSFTSVLPGETLGCVGCHEHRTTSPPRGRTPARQALRAGPTPITPLPDLPDVYDFPRDIQPILDRHCVACHDAEHLAGDVLLTGDHGPMFSHSYFELTRTRQIADGRNQPESNRAPYSIGAVASALMRHLDGRHHDVRTTRRERDIVRFWIEVGAPYPGTYGALGGGMIGGYAENRQVQTDYDWPETRALAAAIDRRCAGCHGKQRPLPRALSDEIGLSFWQPAFTDPRLRFSRHRVFNLTRPARSLLLRAPLSPSVGGLGRCDPNGPGIFRDRRDRDYRAILAAIERGRDDLARRKRFDMPGYTPPAAYVRELRRYGALPATFDPAHDPLDIYEADRRYWRLFETPP